MTEGPRKRNSSGGCEGGGGDWGTQSEHADSQPDVGKDAGGGSDVALKKQIGLVSACGIIVGKCIHMVVSPLTALHY